MSLPLFHIKKLVCSYNNSADKALVINELIIPKGKLVFLLGASGAGKSTLLETLGMMNNTISSGEILLAPTESGSAINLAHLWQNNVVNEITNIRKKYYSFIFQNTNLMENFTAYENVCLSGMIKENVPQENVLAQAKNLMAKVKLPENEVGLNTLAVNLSGGQRQRLAFVRALNNNATVLFGDEPTGNLDEANANELFEVIKSNLGETKSAIVVSHDINLAIKHADLIVILTKDVAKGYGEVLPQNIYARSEWQQNSEEQNQQFKFKIRGLFSTNNEQTVKTLDERGDVNIKNSYRKLFFQKEGNVLYGRRKANLIVLSVILFFTFLAIGFANGSLDYLNKKMNSAFVNWVSVTVPFAKDKEKVNDLIRELKTPENRAKYGYQGITGYIKDYFDVYDSAKKTSIYALGRTVDLENEGDRKLLNENVLSDDKFVRGRKAGFKNKMDIAVIVTEKFLHDFNYPENADFIWVKKDVFDTLLPKEKQNSTVYLPIPIRAVVKELPGRYYFIYPTYFNNIWTNDKGETFSTIASTKYLYGFLPSNDKTEIGKFTKAANDFVANYQLPKNAYDSTVPKLEALVSIDTPALHGGYHLEINFYPNVKNHLSIDDCWKNLLASKPMESFRSRITRVYDYSRASENREEYKPDQISIYFENLHKIRPFSVFLENMNEKSENENNRIEIDITKVIEKENFDFLSTVTLIISFLLIIFSTVAICLFIYNLLNMHLMKVRMNIGTFKAIGLGDNEARNIYFSIIITFILAAAVISILSAYGIGLILNSILVQQMTVETGINYFKIFDWNTLYTVLIILISSLAISWFTIKRILSKSPGDLIYNR